MGWHGIASDGIVLNQMALDGVDGMKWHGIVSDGMVWHVITSDGISWHPIIWDGVDGIGWFRLHEMAWYRIRWHWMAWDGFDGIG